jgi:hypothetical protein
VRGPSFTTSILIAASPDSAIEMSAFSRMLADAHAAHHRRGSAPNGMLLPIKQARERIAPAPTP